MPTMILRTTGADFGIAGDGEDAMLALVRCLMKKEDVSRLPNLVYWHDGSPICNARANVDLSILPVPRRSLFDNRNYEELGAMVGIETKRGCPQGCIYCADPVAKGRVVRLRPPHMVVQELQNLLTHGVSWLHLCDSEFNLPLGHAKEICRSIIEANLGDKIRWYTYCCPIPFDPELANLMKRAGCYGVNFGVDSLCDEQLQRLGRSHSKADVQRLVQILQEQGLNYMFDLLAGGPGETEDTIAMTIGGVKELGVPLAGIAAGVRIYPGTPLSDSIIGGDKRGLHPRDGNAADDPIFYLSPCLGDDVSGLIGKLTAGDSRFLFLASPAEQGSYNYADDEALCQMIKEGGRGAYWDIINRNPGRCICRSRDRNNRQ
jgi:radical SAM superfamily enzyme YgiQ (UPF0313 family)